MSALPTDQTLYYWHQLCEQACQRLSLQLPSDVQAYMLITLMRYFEDDANAADKIEEAQHYLQRDIDSLNPTALKHLGDHCLMVAGLFPAFLQRHALRRSGAIAHYLQNGRTAYQRLSLLTESTAEEASIYSRLNENFIELVDVLVTMRSLMGGNSLSMLQAMDWWTETGSKAAYQLLTANRHSTPLHEALYGSRYRH